MDNGRHFFEKGKYVSDQSGRFARVVEQYANYVLVEWEDLPGLVEIEQLDPAFESVKHHDLPGHLRALWALDEAIQTEAAEEITQEEIDDYTGERFRRLR